MTQELRDYFAAMAMPIILNGFKNSTDKATAKKVADLSYAMADAMLDARSATPPKHPAK